MSKWSNILFIFQTDQQHKLKFNNKKSNSTTTLTASASIENCIGLQYAVQRSTITTNHGIRSSYAQQPTQHLRRLHSKSKIRPISSETKPSSSIAHRIELLKQAMHNPQLAIHHLKTEKSSPIELSTPSLISAIHKQTQTTANPLKSSEINHIHFSSFLSIIGTFLIIFLLIIELTTIIF